MKTCTLSGTCSADASISARVKGSYSGINVLNLDCILSTLTFPTTGSNAITFNTKQGDVVAYFWRYEIGNCCKNDLSEKHSYY